MLTKVAEGMYLDLSEITAVEVVGENRKIPGVYSWFTIKPGTVYVFVSGRISPFEFEPDSDGARFILKLLEDTGEFPSLKT